MSQNGQTHFKNLQDAAKNAARFLKCVWPFSDIMHNSRNLQNRFHDNSHFGLNLIHLFYYFHQLLYENQVVTVSFVSFYVRELFIAKDKYFYGNKTGSNSEKIVEWVGWIGDMVFNILT